MRWASFAKLSAALGHTKSAPQAARTFIPFWGWTAIYCPYFPAHEHRGISVSVQVRRTTVAPWSFRNPAFEGDITYMDGEVTGKQAESAWGVPLVAVKVTMSNQDGAILAEGPAEVEVPL